MIEITEKKYKTAINEVAATESGKLVLAAIKEACRWDATIVSSENPQTTQFYAAQRGIYGSIRSMIKPEHLKQIEFNYRSKPHDNGTRDTIKRHLKPSDRNNKPSKPSDKRK